MPFKKICSGSAHEIQKSAEKVKLKNMKAWGRLDHF